MNKGILLLVISLILFSCRQEDQADLLLFNGTIYSFGSNTGSWEAMAVSGGKVVATGTASGLRKRFRFREEMDLNGKIVYPGFHDAHAHFYGLGKGRSEADLRNLNSWEETVLKVAEFRKENPENIWIIGRGWDQNRWPEKVFPDRKLLDSLFPDIPVMLTRIDGHAVIVNETAIRLAGIDATLKVEGGEIRLRDEGKTLSGVLIDRAGEWVEKVIPPPNPSEIAKYVLKAQEVCLPYGLTAITEAGLPLEVVLVLDSLQRTGQLKMRFYAMLNPGEAEFAFARQKGIWRTDRLGVQSFKLYADGALGSRGALLLKPYCDHQGQGLAMNDATYFDSICRMVAHLGYQANTHCIGDSANRMILTTYATVLKGKNDRRWRIEHAQVVDPSDFHYFRDYSIIPSVQPTHATSDMLWAVHRLCDHRMQGAYAYKTLLKMAGVLPLGTDFPVEEVNPFYTYLAAVYRQNPQLEPQQGFQMQEALDSLSVLKGMTWWPAVSAFREKEWGALEPGYEADFIILEKSLPSLTPAELSRTNPVKEVWIAGEQVYSKK